VTGVTGATGAARAATTAVTNPKKAACETRNRGIRLVA
jgi:hypothetical protein